MAIALRYAARTDLGLGPKSRNEDCGYAGPHLLVLADGMGGHAAGDVASSLIVGQLARSTARASAPSRRCPRWRSRVHEANASLRRADGGRPQAARHGQHDDRHAPHRQQARHGPHRRLPRLHAPRRKLSQITKDHSFVQQLVDEHRHHQGGGRPPPAALPRHPGHDRPARRRARPLAARAAVGDRYLLCSDGLTDFVRARHHRGDPLRGAEPERRRRPAASRSPSRPAPATTSPSSSPTSSTPTVTTCPRTCRRSSAPPASGCEGRTRGDPDQPCREGRRPVARGHRPRRATTTTTSSSPRTAPLAPLDDPAAHHRLSSSSPRSSAAAGMPRGPGRRSSTTSRPTPGTSRSSGASRQDLGPISLSHVESASDVLLSDLPTDVQASVGNTIPARDLADAHVKVDGAARRGDALPAPRRDGHAVRHDPEPTPSPRRRPTSPTTTTHPTLPIPRPSTPRPPSSRRRTGRRARRRPHGRWPRDDDRRAPDAAHAPRRRAAAPAPRDRHRAARLGHDRPQPQRHGAGQHHPHRRRLHRAGAGRPPRAALAAAYADPVLLPITTLLNGLGLVMIHRLDLARGKHGTDGDAVPPADLDRRSAVVLAVVVLILLRDHRLLRRYTFIAMAVGFVLLLLPLSRASARRSTARGSGSASGRSASSPARSRRSPSRSSSPATSCSTRDVLSLGRQAGPRLHLPARPRPRPDPRRLAGQPAVLVFQKDLGSALLFFGLFVAMLYVATERGQLDRHRPAALRGRPSPSRSRLFTHFQKRVDLWLDPFSPDNLERSNQLANGLWGMASGGLTGTGLGRAGPTSRRSPRATSSSPASARSSASSGRRDPRALPHLLRARHPHRARRARRLRQAARDRAVLLGRLPALHRHRRRHAGHPADRPDDALHVARRLVACSRTG